MAFGVCTFFSANSFANAKPQVLWNGQFVYAGINNSDYKVWNDNVATAMCDMLDKKLKSMQKQGQLPFDINIPDSFQNDDVKSKIDANDSQYAALVPVVLSDAVKCDTFDYNGKTWYKYDVRTLISLMFCVKEIDGIHIAYNIPLYSYGMLGDDLGHNLNSGNPELLQQVQNGSLLREQFIANFEGALEDLKVSPSMAKFLSDKKLRVACGQVTKVILDDNVCQKYGSNNMEIPEIVAKVFSSAYLAKHPNMVMLPDVLSGNRWKEKVAKQLDPNLNEASIVMDANPQSIELKVTPYTEKAKAQAWDVVWDIGAGVTYVFDNKKTVVGKPVLQQYRVPKDIQSGGIKALLNVEAIFAGAAMQAAQK